MKKLALLSLLILALPSHAAERDWAKYKSMVEGLRLDKFYAVPAAERDKIKLYISVKPANQAIKPQDVVLIVVKTGFPFIAGLPESSRDGYAPDVVEGEIVIDTMAKCQQSLSLTLTYLPVDSGKWAAEGIRARTQRHTAARHWILLDKPV